MILVATVLSSAVRAAVQVQAQLERASGRSRQDGAETVAPIVDAAFDLALRAAALVVGGAGVLRRVGRPVALVALRPPILPSRFWPQTGLALTVERGRKARANADRVGAQVAGYLLVAMLDDVLDRVDLAGIANRVIDEIDLPAIIRESSGAMASETVLGMRIRGIEADERVNRVVDRVLLRRRDRNALAPAQGDGSG